MQLQMSVYRLMVAQLKSYEAKLKAMSHLPRLLHEKDQSLRELQQREQQYESALLRTKHHLANTIRLNIQQQSAVLASERASTDKSTSAQETPPGTITGRVHSVPMESAGDGELWTATTARKIPRSNLEDVSKLHLDSEIDHEPFTAYHGRDNFGKVQPILTKAEPGSLPCLPLLAPKSSPPGSQPSTGAKLSPRGAAVTGSTDMMPPTSATNSEFFDRVMQQNIQLQDALAQTQKQTSQDIGSALVRF